MLVDAQQAQHQPVALAWRIRILLQRVALVVLTLHFVTDMAASPNVPQRSAVRPKITIESWHHMDTATVAKEWLVLTVA